MTIRRRKPRQRRRAPIQVYLDPEERALLDRLADDYGLSRAEILRRGIRSFATHEGSGRTPMLDFIENVDTTQAVGSADLAVESDGHRRNEYTPYRR